MNAKVKRTYFFPIEVIPAEVPFHDGLPSSTGTFAEFQTNCTITSNFLSYLQGYLGNPETSTTKTRSISIRPRFTEENVTFQLSSSLSIDLCKIKIREYYWLYINAATVKG